jgi:hypothetical protein
MDEWQKLFGFPEDKEFVKRIIDAHDTYIWPAVERCIVGAQSPERAIAYALFNAAFKVCRRLEPDEREAEAYELFERLAEAALTLTALPTLIEEAQGD